MVEVLVTGGAGFIGSNFVRYALRAHPDWHVTTLDKLTYAGRLENLHDVIDNPRHTFVLGDIADARRQRAARPARGHRGALRGRDARRPVAPERRRVHPHRRLRHLRAARGRAAGARAAPVHPDLDRRGLRERARRARPRRPTSCGRAIPTPRARPAPTAWPTATGRRYQVPVIVTRASNNYGPYQFPEKVIPLFITNALDDVPLPLYGDGLNVRDWLHVTDHCRALDLVIERGIDGRGVQHRRRQRGAERRPDAAHPRADGQAASRSSGRWPTGSGHDRRYALDTAKLRALGWAAARRLRRRPAGHRRVVPREPVVVAADQAPGPGLPGLLQGAIRRPSRSPDRPD